MSSSGVEAEGSPSLFLRLGQLNCKGASGTASGNSSLYPSFFLFLLLHLWTRRDVILSTAFSFSSWPLEKGSGGMGKLRRNAKFGGRPSDQSFPLLREVFSSPTAWAGGRPDMQQNFRNSTVDWRVAR